MTVQAVTVHLPPDTLAALDRLAGRTEQSRSAIMAEAIREHVAGENAFHDSLDEADAEFERGEYITHEELIAQIRARRHLETARLEPHGATAAVRDCGLLPSV